MTHTNWPAVSRDEIIRIISAINPITYGKTRNYTNGGTKLSPYITRGLITLPEVYAIIREGYSEKDSEPLLFELAWREYWQHEWWLRDSAIFKDIKRPQTPVVSTQIPEAVLSATTGITALDAAITALTDTGYMHNHERMWLAGLITNLAQTHWWEPSLWMYYHLLDGDPASNSLSWQWVAGTFSSKKYVPTQDNINTYSAHYQTGTYLDYDFTELLASAVPDTLTAREDISLTWEAPQTTPPQIDPSKPTVLYHLFWLNSTWKQDIDANRVLLLEPTWFAQFPVSPLVTDYILRAAAEITGLQVVVADFETYDFGNTVYYMKHPSVTHWQGTGDDMPLLFPDYPEKSFNSFMSFWHTVRK